MTDNLQQKSVAGALRGASASRSESLSKGRGGGQKALDPTSREARIKAALKANLAKRKVQARSREAVDEDAASELSARAGENEHG